ncbi:hypothetical protein CHLRE_09g405776v5 [Chlamydomonas reinhardtii]|uniref:Uncharacterized protein n=1 Tax=Chlamydomonas reinhardtii TaxID=3055 RepID=A0A2K3DFA4_CHLRE|nr:uncharacterized protein CHLRE_09g405776v5 [Chlamydomonas reinhardtii]PNW79197.1 hypothetical protein CHLRE_09g405776v5 [Chlamydomonas reinhardtii]
MTPRHLCRRPRPLLGCSNSCSSVLARQGFRQSLERVDVVMGLSAATANGRWAPGWCATALASCDAFNSWGP